MKHYDLIIAGGGASGLFCAGQAASLGLKVAVLEKGSRPGRKLMLSGGGKCNVANRRVSAENYISSNNKFCLSALARFAPEEMPSRLAKCGIRLEEREHGQIFCADSASDVLEFLLDEMKKHGAELFTGVKVTEAHKNNDLFYIQTQEGTGGGAEFYASALAIACGGPACPQCGAEEGGLAIAKRFGHKALPPAPALVPLIMPPDWPLHDLAGVSLQVEIRLDEKKSPVFNLPLLFTHRGISGPAALQISSYWKKGLELRINFLPGFEVGNIKEKYASGNGKALLRNILSRYLPDRLVARLLPERLSGRRAADLSKKDWLEAGALIHSHQAVPEKTEGWKKAEASTGGVDVNEVSSSSMESKLVAGLFFCGEVLDVCGHLGGYNLQWAWASGQAAARGCLQISRSWSNTL